MTSTTKTIQDLKEEYMSLAKKAQKGKEYLYEKGVFDRQDVINMDKSHAYDDF